MILNAYAVLDTFVSLLRLGLGLTVLGLGWSAWRAWGRHDPDPEGRQTLEDRSHLLLLLAGVLLWLNVLSWPTFYLLLQSYVPQWPGVMCIYGVTRIGTGSLGVSRFLPPLVTALQAIKPALVFLSGAWFVLHLVNRRTRTAPWTDRVLALLLASGLLGVADAAAEITYLVIPKKEVFLSAGCCTTAYGEDADSGRFLPKIRVEGRDAPWLYAAYYAVNVGLALTLAFYGRPGCRRLSAARLLPVAWTALLSAAINALFLVEVAAPRLLHMPDHHCAYDLVAKAPTSLVAVALFIAGGFCVGWAFVAARLGDGPESRPFLPEMVGRLLYSGFLGYVGSVAILSIELTLA
jgi:hypothetical protein